MTDIYLIKRHGILMPSSESDEEIILSLANGETIKCALSKPRNVQFHRLYFALLDVLYNIFDPEVPEDKWYNGVKPVKNRERFRHDIAIATGYYELVVNIKGEVRAEAKSISFSAMDEQEFSQLYNKTIDYGLAKIATRGTREEIDNWTNQLLSFD